MDLLGHISYCTVPVLPGLVWLCASHVSQHGVGMCRMCWTLCLCLSVSLSLSLSLSLFLWSCLSGCIGTSSPDFLECFWLRLLAIKRAIQFWLIWRCRVQLPSLPAGASIGNSNLQFPHRSCTGACSPSKLKRFAMLSAHRLRFGRRIPLHMPPSSLEWLRGHHVRALAPWHQSSLPALSTWELVSWKSQDNMAPKISHSTRPKPNPPQCLTKLMSQRIDKSTPCANLSHIIGISQCVHLRKCIST